MFIKNYASRQHENKTNFSHLNCSN